MYLKYSIIDHISLRFKDEGQIYGKCLAENLRMYTQSNELQRDFGSDTLNRCLLQIIIKNKL